MAEQRTRVTAIGWIAIVLGIAIILLAASTGGNLLLILVGVGFFLLGALSSKLRL
jgi:membrane-bound ClpP family serine protease